MVNGGLISSDSVRIDQGFPTSRHDWPILPTDGGIFRQLAAGRMAVAQFSAKICDWHDICRVPGRTKGQGPEVRKGRLNNVWFEISKPPDRRLRVVADEHDRGWRRGCPGPGFGRSSGSCYLCMTWNRSWPSRPSAFRGRPKTGLKRLFVSRP